MSSERIWAQEVATNACYISFGAGVRMLSLVMLHEVSAASSACFTIADATTESWI